MLPIVAGYFATFLTAGPLVGFLCWVDRFSLGTIMLLGTLGEFCVYGAVCVSLLGFALGTEHFFTGPRDRTAPRPGVRPGNPR